MSDADQDDERGVVIVEQLDGEEALALVVERCEEPAGAYEIEVEGEPITLARYWGHTVPATDDVVRVRHATVLDDGSYQPRGPAYPYPESKVRPVGVTGDETVETGSEEHS